MDKVQEMIDLLKDKREEERNHVFWWILAILGAVCAMAGLAYMIFRHFAPEYLEDLTDEDFRDDFDSYFEDEDDEPLSIEEEVEEKAEESAAEEFKEI